MQELITNDRVIGGITPKCSGRAIELSRTFVTGECIAASNPRVAEMAKVFENTQAYVNIALANELAEICHEHLHKASRVYIEGRLQTRHWQDHDGIAHYRTEVVASDMIMLDARAPRDAHHDDSEGRDQRIARRDDTGDIPF